MEKEGNEAVATAIAWRDGKIMVETEAKVCKVCKVCGRELPISEFRVSRWGKRTDVCRECSRAKYNETKQLRKISSSAERTQPFYDADFEGKQPVEVIQLMSRAKKWLEARGYEITLRGSLTIKKDIKF